MYDRILAINKNKTLSFKLEQLSFTGYHFKKKQTRMITITWLPLMWEGKKIKDLK